MCGIGTIVCFSSPTITTFLTWNGTGFGHLTWMQTIRCFTSFTITTLLTWYSNSIRHFLQDFFSIYTILHIVNIIV